MSEESQYRIETDSLGDVQIPADALWGAQTQRAVDNFPTFARLPFEFIQAVAHIKAAAARVNNEKDVLSADKAKAIVDAAEQIIAGHYSDAFPVDVYQTGSGTSTNMNMNEVIAHLCNNKGIKVQPNDHVNCSQSSNDTIPTAIHISSLMVLGQQLLPAISSLKYILQERANEYQTAIKTGRTHLMDATPITFGQEITTWLKQVEFAEQKLLQAQQDLSFIPQGGTAVGTGINAPEGFAPAMAEQLSAQTGFSLQALEHLFEGQNAIDRPLVYSAALRGYAVVLMKMCNDLRWLGSGPFHGLGELAIPELQPGSSIMPGKVNPVVCESVLMISAQVMGLDQSNQIAGQSGNFQLNVMLPLVAKNLFDMGTLLSQGTTILVEKVLTGMQFHTAEVAQQVAMNPMLVTALAPIIGYRTAAKIAQEAVSTGRTIEQIAAEKTDLSEEQLRKLLDPLALTGQ